MKRILVVALLLPVLVFAQVKSKTAKVPSKVKPAAGKATTEKPVDGFIIKGTVTGYADGAVVALLNGQTGTQEAEGIIKKNEFEIKGKMATPDFRVLLFDKQPPYITLFLDNSALKITGDKTTLTRLTITGSPSHHDFETLVAGITPYQQVFQEGSPFDANAVEQVGAFTENFARQKPASFIAALAVIRFAQATEDDQKTIELYNLLTPEVKSSWMGNYLAQLVREASKNAIGSVLPDFSQPDTAGVAVSLSSLRGKYVLIDFWASWCGPCRRENPTVVAAYNRYKDKNFTVLGVSLDRTKDPWINAIKMDGLAWPHVSDLKGWQNSVAQQFGISQIPQNLLIGPDGKILGKNLRGAKLERKLAILLN